MKKRELEVAQRSEAWPLVNEERKKATEVPRVAYLRRANFAVAFLSTSAGVRVGVAKRNPSDGERPNSGELLALRRAVRSSAALRGGA